MHSDRMRTNAISKSMIQVLYYGHGERGGGERSKAWLLMGERGGEA